MESHACFFKTKRFHTPTGVNVVHEQTESASAQTNRNNWLTVQLQPRLSLSASSPSMAPTTFVYLANVTGRGCIIVRGATTQTLLEGWSARHLMIIQPCKSLHLGKLSLSMMVQVCAAGPQRDQHSPHGARAPRRSGVSRCCKIISRWAGIATPTL